MYIVLERFKQELIKGEEVRQLKICKKKKKRRIGLW